MTENFPDNGLGTLIRILLANLYLSKNISSDAIYFESIASNGIFFEGYCM